MMNLHTIKKDLCRQIRNKPSLVFFRSIQKRIFEFTAFAKPEDIVMLFRKTDNEYLNEKAYLLRIILEEYQQRPNQFWSSLLILCFIPWLVNCYKRSKDKTEMDREELTMLVVESFLESASNMNVENDSICILTLLLNTEKQVIRHVMKENEKFEIEQATPFIDFKYDSVSAMSPEELMMCRELHMDDKQMEKVSGEDDNEMLELLHSIIMNNDSVSDYVERKYHKEKAEEKTLQYERIRKNLWRFRKKVNFACPERTAK